MSDWKILNACRVREGYFKSSDLDGFNGQFNIQINGLHVLCQASDGMNWQHVSASIIGSVNPPSWNMMCKIKELFWDDQDWVIQYHPAKEDYVNIHPGVLHLWKPLNLDIPKPPKICV